ncbi:thaumatin family protein [Streptomyces sp. NPDC087270]|uniref:thaumatin family protein n=1 Tax=Streptomyces sp. NPDC087270 TaxID=3365774 RepID=UPI0038218EC0
MRLRSALSALLLLVSCVLAATAAAGGPAAAATAPHRTTAPATATATATAAPTVTEHTVTLVNDTGQTIWIGSNVNADGSAQLTGLPTLDTGQSATVAIPEDTGAGHWRGKFFAREGCSGADGSTFHCVLGDCGASVGSCTTGEQPVSLAEFNFDPSDSLAPWYNVSYVNAFSVPVTISPDGVAPPPDGGACAPEGCPDDLLPYCPPDDLTTDAGTGLALCVNPDRDAQTPYSDAIGGHCPWAYAWSKADTVPGNKVVRDCTSCSGFTVTFH